MRIRSSFIFLSYPYTMSLTLYLKGCISSVERICIFVKKKISLADVHRSVSGSSGLPTVLYHPTTYHRIWITVDESVGTRRLMLPALYFSKSFLDILVPLLFHVHFRMILFMSTKHLAEICIGIALDLYIIQKSWCFYC